MNDVQVTQESLFEDPLGMRLRAARERAHLGLEQAAQQLKLPVAVVEAMEREDWARLGARIYVRSYLGSYLRLLGLPETLLEQVDGTREQDQPALVTLATRSRMRHTLETSVRQFVYLVMTIALVGSVVLIAQHFQARDQLPELALDSAAPALPDDVASAAVVDAARPLPPPPPSTTAPAPAAAETAAMPAADPVLASLAPFRSSDPGQALVLNFRQESWLEVIDADGVRIERGLVAAGGERRYEPGSITRVTIGNADGVDVLHAGAAIDLAPFRAANVARFAVSSDGQPAAAAR